MNRLSNYTIISSKNPAYLLDFWIDYILYFDLYKIQFFC